MDGLKGEPSRNQATSYLGPDAKLRSLTDEERISFGFDPRGTRRRPSSRVIASWEQAEGCALEWMQYLGFDDAQLTGPGADGGIDIRSRRAVAQVKAEGRATGNQVVLQIRGSSYTVASGKRAREAIVFSLAGFTRAARKAADDCDVALFQMDPFGRVNPENDSARRLWR